MLCLTETFESLQEPVKFRNWSKLGRARDDGYGGVAILYKDDEDGVYINRRTELENQDVEAICAEVTVKTRESVLLIAAYVPPQRNDQMQGLIEIIKEGKKKFHHILVTGDFNAKSHSWNNRSINTCGSLLEGFLYETGIVCMNDGQPTRRASDSVIDLYLVSPKLVQHVESCQTLSHENVRSDHIGVSLELFKLPEKDPVSVERWVISKTDWNIWNKCTEKGFKEWNKMTESFESMDEMAESFMEVYIKCLTEAVPKRETKVMNRRKKPPWWSEETQTARHELNMAKKTYKRRRTPINFKNLREKEESFMSRAENAKDDWTKNLCERISRAESPKEMWENFKSLTSYEQLDGGGMLPLLDENNVPVFDSSEKCDILQGLFFGGRHLDECQFDDNFKEDVDNVLSEINQVDPSLESSVNEDDELNYDITKCEVEAVLQNLKKSKAPGPDNVYADVLRNAGDEMTNAVHKLFQKSWQTGKIPSQWKEAEVKFLRKQGKKSYHDAGSYRPISLTSCICKCMERIIIHRLYGYVEHHELLDREQEGFRKFRGTSQALLRLTQDIYNGFNDKQHTVAFFIDLEKAYDSVWREGLIVKLFRMGIRGKIWRWIKDFLSDRHAAITIRGEKGEKFESQLGLPQGSVLSPLLFNLYTTDIYNRVRNQKVKFADDGTIWRTGNNVPQIIESLKEDLLEVMQWSNKWRMKISLPKTEFCIFTMDSKITEQWQTTSLLIDNKSVAYNKTPKMLGITLDEKLKFDKHIEIIERKGHRSVDMLRRVKESECVKPKCLLQLYKAMVRPQIEYAAAVWQNGKCDPLDRVQRKGLSVCLGLPGTAGIEAMEVEAGIVPLTLRREELAIRETTRILMKDNSNLIKESWDKWKADGRAERKVSPFGLMDIQVADMVSNTGIQIHNLEKQMSFIAALQPSREPPEYWKSLGSSKNRSKEQEMSSRLIVGNMVESCSTNTAIAFTDGSCMGNPGPCGSGAFIIIPGNDDPVCLKRAVSKNGSILLGELVAIQMTIEYITGRSNTGIEQLHIFSDSQTAVGVLTLGWDAKTHGCTIQETKRAVDRLNQAGVTLEISWTPGHSDIRGNDIADQLAKEGATEADQMEEDSGVTTAGDVKLAAKKSGLRKWQDRWEKSERGRDLYQFRPSVGVIVKHTFQTPQSEGAISQLRTGYARLNEYLHKIGSKDTNQCLCGEIETVTHYLQHCPNYQTERDRFWVNIQRLTGLIQPDVQILLQVTDDDNYQESRDDILEELENYIIASGRFANH